MQKLQFANIHSIFPRAQYNFFKHLYGKRAAIRLTRLALGSDYTWYIVLDQYDYEARKITHAYTEYIQLGVDPVFNVITHKTVGYPPISLGERYWHEAHTQLPDFALWHMTVLLPELKFAPGFDRTIIQCYYFRPRGIDNPCDELERVNTYEDTVRSQRDAKNAQWFDDARNGLRPMPAIGRKPMRREPGKSPFSSE